MWYMEIWLILLGGPFEVDGGVAEKLDLDRERGRVKTDRTCASSSRWRSRYAMYSPAPQQQARMMVASLGPGRMISFASPRRKA